MKKKGIDGAGEDAMGMAVRKSRKTVESFRGRIEGCGGMRVWSGFAQGSRNGGVVGKYAGNGGNRGVFHVERSGAMG
ncbi:hypothetical protein GCM10011586_17760 [Silvibacterium dinghuense]|nr:hypothetical protein GCM10011586_17760 [Silvibacterium dinghuense]